MLHIVNCAQAKHPRLMECLRCLQAGESVLFLHSEPAFWHQESAALSTIKTLIDQQANRFYRLENTGAPKDMDALGIIPVDYRDWVQLTEQHPHIQSWF